MRSKKLLALVLTAVVMTSNVQTVVSATTNNTQISVLSEGYTVYEEGIVPLYEPALTQGDLVFAARDLENGTEFAMPDEIKTLTEGTIVIRFEVPDLTSGDTPSIISFSDSTKPNNYFNIYLKTQNDTQAEVGMRCYKDGVLSPSGQQFGSKSYVKAGMNTLAISIRDGEGYSIALNNTLKWTGSNTNIKFLNSMEGLDTISIGKTVISNDQGATKNNINSSNINVKLVEIYNKRIDNNKAQNLGTFHFDANKINGVTVAAYSSEETQGENGRASRAVDGDITTYWHSRYNGQPAASKPHFITLALNGEYFTDTIKYLPRQGSGNGRIKGYKLYGSNEIPQQSDISSDGTITRDGFKELSSGPLANDESLKEINYNPVNVQYITLIATDTETDHATAAEFYIIEAEPIPTPVVNNLQIVEGSLGINEATISWELSDEEERQYIESYLIYKNDELVAELPADSSTYTFEGLEGSTEYNFSVATKNKREQISGLVTITESTLGEVSEEISIEELNITGGNEFGDTLNIDSTVSGGSGNLLYRYVAYTPQGKWIELRGWEANSELEWTPDLSGSYTVEVQVKDETETIKRLSQIHTISNSELRANITIVGSQVNEDVILNAEVTGAKGDGATQYRYVAYTPQGQWEELRGWDTASEFAWTPDLSGHYTVEVQVKDATGATKTSAERHTISNNRLTANLTIDGSQINEVVRLNAEVTGAEEGSVEYRYVAYTPQGQWIELRGWEAESTHEWRPTATGSYTVEVQVKDATGAIKKSTKVHTISNNSLRANLTINGNEVNEAVILNAEVEGSKGEGLVEYRYVAYTPEREWIELRGWNTASEYSWTPNLAGNYTVEVQVKDGTGTIKTSAKRHIISNNGLTANLTIDGNEVNEAVRLNAEIGGVKGEGAVQYRYVAYTPEGNWIELRGWETESAYEWRPTVTGYYTVEVQVKDGTGTTKISVKRHAITNVASE